jgi:chromate transporter
MTEPGAEPKVSFREAFYFWLKLGFISFGGPAGQIAIMHRELVDKRRWLGEERFLHALNYCMILPGPEAQQLAIYIGWLMHRTIGGIVAGVFFVLPSVFILFLLSFIYAAYGHVTIVAGLLEGFKAVVVAIVVEAVLKIGKRAVRTRVHIAIAAAAFISIYFLAIPFPLIVLGAAVAGLAGTYLLPSVFHTPAALPSTKAKGDVPEPEPATTTGLGGRALRVIALGAMLWLIPFLIVNLIWGFESFYASEYRFFSIASLVTFGGAYAVLAYVTQSVTAAPYSWITPSQAVDGLALAETTPGPLIMVLQFVGFIAGWNNPVGGLSPLASGVIGGLIATYTTFLPSFIFIFLGAPYVEKLRNNRMLTGAFTAVTAAVVGVVLNLALVFGEAVIFPSGIGAGTNWFAAVVGIAAFIAGYYLKIDVLWVVLAGGAAGLIFTVLMS